MGQALDSIRPWPTFVDGNEVEPFRGDTAKPWLAAKQCTADAVKASSGGEKTKWRCRPCSVLFNLPVSVRIRSLAFVVLLGAFEPILRTMPNEHASINGLYHPGPIKVESRTSNVNRRPLVDGRGGKEGQNARHGRGTFRASFLKVTCRTD